MTQTLALSDRFTTLTAPTAARRRFRSAGAIVAGLLATIVLTTAVDIALHSIGVFPPMPQRMSDALFLVALAYRVPLNAFGCYLAGRLAPSAPLRHALALGALGTVLATLGAIAMWQFGPAWYSLANIAVALPCAVLGGKLSQRTCA